MVVNNQPIYTSKGNRYTYVTIMPSQFLNPGDPKNYEQILANTLAPLTIDVHPEEIAARFKHQQKFLQRLYNSFQQLYLDGCQQWHNQDIFTNRQQQTKMVKEGDLVLLKPFMEFKKDCAWPKQLGI